MFQAALAGNYHLFTQYYFDWQPLKSQWVEHYAPQTNIIHLGGVGCVAGGTLLTDPISGRTHSFHEWSRRNRPLFVASIDEHGQIVAAVAMPPFVKGIADLYRVHFESGEAITVTEQHRFLTPDGWQSLSDMPLKYVAAPLGSTLDSYQSTHASDAEHWSQTVPDCRGCYRSDPRFCDELPHIGGEVCLGSTPLQAGALSHNHPSWHRDAQGSTPGYSLSCPRYVRHAMHDCCLRTVLPDCGVQCHASSWCDELAQLHNRIPLRCEMYSSPAQSGDVCSRCQIDTWEAHHTCHGVYQTSYALCQRSLHGLCSTYVQSPYRSILPQQASESCHDIAVWRAYDAPFTRITKILYAGQDLFYDIHVPCQKNYLAGSVVNHNSGKTAGKAISFLTKALTQPWYRGLNTSISSFQATLMYQYLLPLVEGNRVSRFISEVRSKPYPKIKTVFNSYLAFMTVGYEAQGIRGSEWDEINFDEGGFERSEATIIALRGRLRGTRENKVPRLARMSVTTTPTDVPWLRTRWERGTPGSTMEVHQPKSYAAIRSTLYDNHHIPDWQREEIVKDMPEEMLKQEIFAEFPDWGDSEFSEAHINACENHWLNAELELMFNPVVVHEDGTESAGRPVEGCCTMELPRVGTVLWEMPANPKRTYMAATDPGTASPPKRNAGVTIVFDVTEKPYRLVFFKWTSGNGSYIPWLRDFKYALEKYQPIARAMDATGPQKALDELVLEREGIPVDGIHIGSDKMNMLNSLKMLLQNHEIEFPFIKGLRSQLRAYKIKDEKIAQDIVSTLMVFAYVARAVPNKKSTVELRRGTYDHRAGRDDRRRTQILRRSPR